MTDAPVKLVTDGFSDETVRTLEDLLIQARTGDCVGLAFVAVYARREFMASVTGEAKRNPTYTRGMLAALDDALADMLGL